MSGFDRLSELRAGRSGDDNDEKEEKRPNLTGSTGGTDDITDHMKRYDGIKKALELIKSNTDAVDRLKSRNKTTANEKSRKEIMNNLDEIMASTNQQAGSIKRTLDEIKTENTNYSHEKGVSAKTQMRNNLYQTHIRRFHAVMNDYNNAAYSFKQDLQNRIRHEVKIVYSNLPDNDIDKLIESGKAGDIIKQVLINDDLADQVRVVEERHIDILKLEQQVQEINELFKDLSTLVDLQQESLDIIENRIMTAKNYTEGGEVNLNEAEEYQKKARQKQCCLLFICLGLLIIVIAVVLGIRAIPRP